MEYKIITDRLEIEKMAEDIFLPDDEYLVNIDYADLRLLKQRGTFRQAIICEIDLENKGWVDEFIKTIQSLQLPIDKLRASLLNFIVGGKKPALKEEDVSNILQFIYHIKCKEDDPDNDLCNRISFVWTARNRHSMPKEALRIQLYLAYEKTEQDKQEDEKYEQIMEDYRKQFFPEDPIDFSNLIVTDDNDEK